MADPVIRLDTSRMFSTVHGERGPDDPHYRVHFFQASLPFDGNGVLVPDDGKMEPYIGIVGQTADGKPIPMTFLPLYDSRMREVLKARSERLKAGRPVTLDQVDEHDSDDLRSAAAQEVNLISWLRGEVDYQPHILYKAWADRQGRKHTSLRALVEDLVVDEKIVPEVEVAAHLMRLIDSPASAVARR